MSETVVEIPVQEVVKVDVFNDDNWKEESQQTVVETKTEESAEESFDESDYLKNNFGWESVDTAKKELEELRKLKENPIVKEKEIEFANEDSKKLFESIKEGKIDEVYDLLDKKKKLSSVDKLDAANTIKLHLQLANKHYTPEDVQDVFEERYTKPAKPVQDADEADEDYNSRVAQWQSSVDKITRRIERDARTAKEDLAKINTEWILPDIAKGKDPAILAQQQEELQKREAGRNAYLQTLESDYKNFTGFNAVYKDKDVEVQSAYGITPEEQVAYRDKMKDFNSDEFLNSRWFDKEGKPNVNQIMSDVYLLENRDKVVQKLVNDAVGKRMDAYIKAQKNVSVEGKSQGEPVKVDAKTQQDKEVAAIWDA